ncbi:MAG: hypothetical protein NC217_03080 [Muribaculaceae bacterium]|nr:hypothetical protein [Muribaculaceae bacterium]
MNMFTRLCNTPGALKGMLAAMGVMCFMGLSAQSTPTQSDLYEDEDTGYLQYNSEFYAQFTYEWTDENGVTHTSTLADRAESVPQMIAMLKEVYVNPEIPGFVEDPTYAGGSNQADGKPNNYYKVPYMPCTEAPYYMSPDEVVPTPVEGATALMVELHDDYVFDEHADPMALFSKIKAISIVPHAMYIGKQTFTENPGWLFNYIGVIDKFFIITKGNNRIADNSNTGYAPFYYMFEEFSPSNKQPVTDAYAAMNSGETFAVDHNCTTVLGQNHIIEMSPEGVAHEYPMNFMFYLPDRRFYGNSSTNTATGESFEWYTYYNKDYMPFFFFNKIRAEIKNLPEVNSADRTAMVKIEWKSTYKDVAKAHYVPESFYIYRVVNDVIQPQPVTEFYIPEDKMGLTGKFDDGEYVSKESTCVAYIQEPQNSASYNVKYIIKGRRYGSKFEYTESNIVSTTIPGYEVQEDLSILIEGAPKSTYIHDTQENVYANKISLSEEPPVGGSPILAGQIRVKDENVPGTIFQLMRYTDDPSEAVSIAKMEVVDRTNVTWNGNNVGVWKYTADITYADTSLLDPEAPRIAEFRSGRDINGVIPDEEYPIEAVDAGKGIIVKFIDNFKVSTRNGEHPASYHYYMTVETASSAKRAAAKDENLSARSNTVDVAVPVRELKVGYTTYNQSQMDADTDFDNLLEPNKMAIMFETRSNPSLTSYTITNVTKGHTVVSASRMPTGTLEVSRKEANGNMAVYNRYENSMWINPIVELKGENDPGDVYSLVLKYENGNTYGNIRQELQALPFTYMKYAGLKAEKDNPGYYSTYCEWGMVDNDEWTFSSDSQFTPIEWRHWGKSDTDSSVTLLDDVEQTSNDRSSSKANLIFAAHDASEQNPVEYTHYSRAYFELPESMRISDDENARLAVLDNQTHLMAVDAGGVTTGVEDVIAPEDVTYRYFDISGVEYPYDSLPKGVIIRIGSDGSAEKLIR